MIAETECPNCDATIRAADPRPRHLIVCPECGVELEIVATDPLEVDFSADWQQ
jgi:lysine biosynthesis protein LysW